MADCYFKVHVSSYQCKSSDTKLCTSGPARIKKIIQSSKDRSDELHIELQKQLDEDINLTITCHKTCASSYTSSAHIKRRKRDNESPEQPTTSAKRSRRSELPPFDFREHCFFCGTICKMDKDPKNPNRWRKVVLCRTSDRGSNIKPFKDVVLDVCDKRGLNDTWGNQVRVRVQSALSDLHAADARYHDDCRTTFMSPRSIQAASNQDEQSEKRDCAFEAVVNEMKSDLSHIWTSVDIFDVYKRHDGTSLSRCMLIKRLSEIFDKELIILSATGLANILVFRDRASILLRVVEDEEDDASIGKVAKQIVRESRKLNGDKSSYNTRIDVAKASKEVSPTLQNLLASISKELDSTLPSLLIGNIITGIITKHPTSLQVALGVLVREKKLLEQLCNYGVTCTYKEVLRFKSSAAAASAQKTALRVVSDSSNGLVQVVADNFDANISSPNGRQSTHALAMLLTQPNSMLLEDVEDGTEDTIKRLKQEEMTNEVVPDIPIQSYNGPKKPSMPRDEATRSVPTLRVLAQQSISVRRASNMDFQFYSSIATKPTTPEFGGFNTRLARDEDRIVKPSTNVMYTPLIDMVPSDPTTMMTAMVEAQELTKQTGQVITVFTADQQLYRVMVNVIWTYPEMFSNFIPRLGGMHMLMSFVGCVGVLMAGSGLEEVLKSSFGGVVRMLTGKNFPQNTRALRMVVEAILQGIIESVDSHEDLMVVLETRAASSRTAKLWIDNLIRPVLIMMIFVRAEREADWPLHLRAVNSMIPYFFAAAHINYARYGLYYLRSMERLPNDVLARFMEGEHVMRHKPGLWNGLWSDMLIETTFMRYGHGPGGLIGITLNPSALKRWALSLHICSRLIKDLAEMKDSNSTSHQVVKTHKEEMPARQKSDAKDRENIRKKLQTSIDPLNPDDHPTGLIDIVSGRIAPESVNADDAVAIGIKQMNEYESSLPEGFYSSLSKKVVTMDVSKKHIRIGPASLFDTELIFSRVLGLMASRTMNVEDIFRYELAPIPTSMFEDSGDMRITKSKSTMKRKLQVEQSARLLTQPEAIIIDGCAILWIIHWPANGKVEDFVQGFVMYIKEKLSKADVYLIFDRYFEFSIKGATRSGRAGKQVSRQHQLSLNSPLPPQQVTLNNTKNKVQLIDIICQQLLARVKVLQENHTVVHRLVLTGSSFVPIEVSLGIVIQRRDMRTSHEEADVIIPQQVVLIVTQGIENIKVICDDTDVFLLLIYYYVDRKLACNLCMEGTSSQRATIDIAATAKKHADIVPQFLAAHAISGCDTVAYLWGIGKATVIKVLLKGHKLDKLGDVEQAMDDIIAEATTFVAACYGSKSTASMSELRYKTWLTKVARRKVTTTPKLKTLPPTTEAFVENVKRAHLQVSIWKAVMQQDAPDLDPCQFGWLKDDQNKSLTPVTLPDDVEPAPSEILKLIRCGCESDPPCASGRCRCLTAQLACTIFCECRRDGSQFDGNCQNKWTKDAAAEQSEQEDTDEETDE